MKGGTLSIYEILRRRSPLPASLGHRCNSGRYRPAGATFGSSRPLMGYLPGASAPAPSALIARCFNRALSKGYFFVLNIFYYN